MPSISTFYLHDATTEVAGTLPGADTLSATSSSVAVAGAGTNRSMDGTIGTSQSTATYTTLNNQSAQPSFVRRFISDPLGVNAFGAGNLLRLHGRVGLAQSNTISRVTFTVKAWVWRPSTGAVVGSIYDVNDDEGTTGATAQTWRFFTSTVAGAVNAVNSADGDVLVVELWRGNTTQTMSTAYTNSYGYDGTTEPAATGSVASAGSAIWFAATTSTGADREPIEMSSGAPPPAEAMLDPMGARGWFGA